MDSRGGHWPRVDPTNRLERPDKEIKRRANMIDELPSIVS